MRKSLLMVMMTAVGVMSAAVGRVSAQETETEGAEMSQGNHKEVLGYFKDSHPEMHQELSRSPSGRSRGFRGKMREMMPLLKDPETRELVKRNMAAEFKTRKLAERMSKATGKEKESLKSDLEKSVSELFDAKLSAQEARLKKMQEKIAGLKEKIDKRRSLKAQIVKKRLSELSGETESWEW